MNRFFRTLTGVLSASIIISSVTFLPVLAQAPDVSQSTEQMTTTENEDSDSSSSVNDETQDVAVIFTETAGEDGMTSGSLAGTTDTIQDMNSLATALGVDNVSVLSETQVMLVKDIVIPTGQDKSFLFAEGSYTIDFNGHIIRGQFGFYLLAGHVTLIDSSGSNTGGFRCEPIVMEEDACSYYMPLNISGGELTIKSGKYVGFKQVIYARNGSMQIEGGSFHAYGGAGWVSDNAVEVFQTINQAVITGGSFEAEKSAVYCTTGIDGNMRLLSNPLQISGGSFKGDEGAVVYWNEKNNQIPDIQDLLADGAGFVPPNTQPGYGPYGERFIRTENNVRVFILTGIEGFVYRLYSKVLQREPDTTGLLNWVKQLNEKTISGSDAAYGFFFSQELTKRNLTNEEFVTLLYNTFFDRNPDAGGMKTWLSALESGASRKYVFSGFANSQEWKNLCAGYGIEPGSYTSDEPRDQNLKVTAFVQRLYNLCLNRGADVDGLNNWTKALNSQSQDGAHVAYGFFFSQEFIGRKLSNADYVEVLYKVLLGRGSDPAGKANWVKQLDAGTERMDIFRGFVHSQEFDKICADYGIVRGTI